MKAVENSRVTAICNAARTRYKKTIIVDMSGRHLLSHFAGRDCVRVTPPTSTTNSDKALFKLEKFRNGALAETVMLQEISGRYFFV
jgi:hypothetical protein